MDSCHVLQNDQDALLVLELNLLVFDHKFLVSSLFIKVLVFQLDFVELSKSEEIPSFD